MSEGYDAVLFDAMLALSPCPEEPFEVAFWAQKMEQTAEEMRAYASRMFYEYITMIYEEGLCSSRFEILFPTEPVHSVDCEALKRDFPEVFEELVFVPGPDALRILGRKPLYALCRKENADRTENCARVNLGDLRKVLRPEEISAYVAVAEKPLKPVVVAIP